MFWAARYDPSPRVRIGDDLRNDFNNFGMRFTNAFLRSL